MGTLQQAKQRHEQQMNERYNVNYDEIVELFCAVDDAAKSVDGAVKWGRSRMIDYPSFLLWGYRINAVSLGKLSAINETLQDAVSACSEPVFGYTIVHLHLLQGAMQMARELGEFQAAYLEKQAREREERHMMQIKLGYGY
jgi:hypothetical protein